MQNAEPKITQFIIDVRVDDLQDFIVRHVEEHPGIRLCALARKCGGVSYNQVRARVYELEAKGILFTKRIRWRVFVYVRPEVVQHDSISK